MPQLTENMVSTEILRFRKQSKNFPAMKLRNENSPKDSDFPKKSTEHGESNFYNPTNEFSPKNRNFLRNVPEQINLLGSLQNLVFIKRSSKRSECSFGNLANFFVWNG